MKRILLLSLVIIGVSCNTPQVKCPNKKSFLNSFEDFVSDVKEHYRDISINDWESIDKEFELYADQCYEKYEDELSIGEKVDFVKNTLTYAYYKGKVDGDIDIDLSDLHISEDLEDISIESKEELEKFIKEELGQDIEEALDDLMDGMKDISEEIKNWLKEE